MARTLIIANAAATVTTTTTRFARISPSLSLGNTSEEGRYASKFTQAGTLSELAIYSSVNGTTSPSTLTTRKNLTTDGSQSVSITAGTTGWFEDPTGNDSVSAGDTWAYKFVLGSANSSTFRVIQMSYSASSNTVSHISCDGAISSAAVSTSYFFPIGGDLQTPPSTSETAGAKVRMRKTADLKNVHVYVHVSSSQAHTVKLRKNAADSGISISLTASTTGWFSETSTTVSVVAGDDVNYLLTTGSNTTNLNITGFDLDYITTTGIGLIVAGKHITEAYVKNTTYYNTPGNAISIQQTTESNYQIKTRTNHTFSELCGYVTANATAAAGNYIKLRKASASTSLQCTWGSGVTGLQTDTTNTVASTVGDLVGIEIRNNATSGGGVKNIAFIWWAVNYTIPELYTRSISESSIAVSETTGSTLTGMRSIADTVTVSDSLARTEFANRSLADTVVVSDSLDRVLLANRALSESSIAVSDSVTTLWTAVRLIDEDIDVSETVNRLLTAFRVISESSIAVSDSIVAGLLFSRSITESAIVVSDSVARMLIALRTIDENVAVSETVDRLLTAFRTISESSIAVSETVNRVWIQVRSISESSIGVSETLNRLLTAFRIIGESSIVVSDTVAAFVPIVRTINEPSVTVSDSIARLLSAFRVVSESVTVLDHLAIVGPDYEIAVYITDKGYTNPLRARIRFVDRHDESHVLYEYDSFNPDQRPFNILGASIRLAQGEIGGFTINIEDSAKTVIKENIGFGTKVQIDVKKEYGIPWMRVMTGFVRRVGKIRSATNTLQWQIAGVGTQVVFNERVTNYKRAAKRSSVDSIDPLPTDSRMFASNLFKDLISATDVLPLRRPSLMETGGFTLDDISPDVTDFIAQVSPGLTDAASVANAFSELTGAIWGCNSEGNPFFRYPTQKHSGIIIKDDPQDTDSALITSTNLDAFDYQDSIDLSEGFANRLYVLNAVDTKSTASSSGASGSTTLTFRGIAQQFTATDNNINGAAFILSKVGNPTNKDNCVFGYLRGDSNGYPTGPTLASFQITFDQIETAKSTIFVNDIKPKEGTIIPGNKYWWFLFSALTSESNTIRWHHDNDQLTINRFSAILPFIDQDPTKAGNQLFWTRSDKGPVYAFSTFSSIRHILEHSDPESIKEYGLVEGIVDLPAFEDDNTFQKALVQILKTSSKPKRIYNYARVTIPTQTLFFPGELVTIIDSKADLTSEKNVIAEIAQVQYTFDTSRNAMGCKTVDIMLISFVDKILDDYLDNNTC